MGILIKCYDPSTGQIKTIEANTVGIGGGGSTPQYPNFMAERLNLSMMDVQQSIAEGRARGIKPFNIIGSPNDIQRGALS